MQKANFRSAPRYRAGAKSRGPAPRRYRSTSNTIDINRFINKAAQPKAEQAYQPENSFDSFGLNAKLTATLKYIGYIQPSPVQDQCIPYAMKGRDVIGLARTGTGKTAAFLLPAIDRLCANPQVGSVLVIAPTRELAQQTDSEFRRFAAGLKLHSALVVGGVNIGKQIQQVRRGPHVIIGTPGRIKDLIGRKVLRLNSVQTFILDEADRMCDMGFINDIRAIASELPKNRQTMCYSATMTPPVKKIVQEFMNDPVTVALASNQTNDHIEQNVVYASDRSQKIELLADMLAREEFKKVIIFGETKFGVQRLADGLTRKNLPAVAIHGNKSQSQRTRALQTFKSSNNGVNILVATDVAARGIDVDDVSHVINYDIPQTYEDYIHRIGRTGRAGKLGSALTFVPGRPA